MKYSRVLLKLSGESLAGKQGYGIGPDMIKFYAEEIKKICDEKIQVTIVLGGGNIFRGLNNAIPGFNRVQGDYMGMLATVINSLALQETLVQYGISSIVLSGLEIQPLCQRFSAKRAIEAMNEGQVVIAAGGTGNPFFTTDTAAVLRAVEIGADLVIKGTRVDGVYSADPEKNPDAVKYDQLTFDEALSKKLNIVDLTAYTLCIENKLPLAVYNAHKPDFLFKLLNGDSVGTIVF